MRRPAVILLVVLAAAGGAGGAGRAQSDGAAALPSHPIPYRLLEARRRRPPHAAKPAAAPARPGPGAATPPAPPPPASASSQGPAAPARSNRAAPPPRPPAPPPVRPAAATPAPVQVAPPPLVPTPAPQRASAPPPPPPSSPAPAAPPPDVASAARPPLPDAALAAFVDGEVEAAVVRGRLAGAVVSVVQNGRVVLLKGYGRADGARPMDGARTRLRLGGASRLLTRLIALRLTNEGRLSLGRPINELLPEDLRIPDEGFAAPVLVRNLMTDTAGFEDRALGRRWRLAAEEVTPLRAALTRDRPRRVRPVDAGAVPSVYGTALLGETAALVAGEPFEDLAERELFGPLGLSRTSFREPRRPLPGLPQPMAPAAAAELAQGYVDAKGGLVPQPYAFAGALAPGVGATTTAADMARLSLALLAPQGTQDVGLKGALSPILWRGPEGVPGAAAALPAVRLPGGRLGFAAFGDAPGFVAGLVLAPDLGVGVFVAGTGSDRTFAQGLAPAIIGRFFGGDAATPPAAGPLAAGVLLPAERAYHGLEAFVDGLRLRETVETTPDGSAVTIEGPSETRTYLRSHDGLFRSLDGGSLFVLTSEGTVKGYVRDGGRGAGEPVGPLHALTLLVSLAVAVAVTAAWTVLAALSRLRAEPRETSAQTLASAIAVAASLAWLAAIALAAVFLQGGLEDTRLLADWPSRSLVAAAWLALAAAALTLLALIQTPGVWREGRRLHGWRLTRKLAHAAAILLYLAFAVTLAAWGALEPWSS